MDYLLQTDLQHKDDDHRLYYVACSRARNRLFINLPELSKEEKEKLIGKFGDVIFLVHIRTMSEIHLSEAIQLITEYGKIVNKLGTVTSPLCQLGIYRLKATE